MIENHNDRPTSIPDPIFPETTDPLVTVIMPARNEEAFLKRSLTAILEQDYPEDKLEIVVADGRSGDGTRRIVKALQASHSGLRLIDNPGELAATGLNHAIRVARGEIIVRIDGHTIVAPDYVRQCVAALRRTRADNAGGRMAAVGEGPVGRAVALATSSRFGVGGAAFHYLDREAWVDTVYLGAWPREVFNRIGLFDESMVRNQDDELNYRLRAAGGKILLSPTIRSRYYNRATLRSLARQYFLYGLWKVRVLQKHSRQMRPRQLVPPLFVLSLLLGMSATLFFPPATWLLLAITGAYGALNLAASLWTGLRSGPRHLPLLPVVFAILHFAYGAGFLLGVVRFAHRWGDRRGRVPALETPAE